MTGKNLKYTTFAIIVHWLMVILVAVMFLIGWHMVDLPRGSDRGYFFALHKSLGLTVFLLLLLRLFWRIKNAPPKLPPEVSQFRRQVSGVVHRLFYILLFLQPISGYMSSSFSGYKTSFFSLALPHWGWSDPPLNELLTELHVIFSISLMLTVVLHVVGVVMHVVEGHSHLFRRMWF